MEKRFSDWLKIDLHIHTDISRITKEDDYEGAFSVQTLKEKLIENNVKIFSLTDHNIINIGAYEEYFNLYTDQDPLLLLGIELDVLVKRNNKEKTYHTLLVFDCSDIESVKEISSRLESRYTEKAILDPKTRLLDISDIVELFPKDNYFFIPHAYSDKNIVTAHKDGAIVEAQKMVLLMQCALEKVTKEETKSVYNQGFNTLLTKSFRSKNDIPYINFSDNHCISRYPCRHKGNGGIGNHAFYFIKGSKSYESIRLAFIDPESRIKTTEEFNSINHTNNTIDYLSITGDSIITDCTLEFSPHLNVIIGGRSSGKSLLMWMLGKKIDSLDIEAKYGKVNIDNILIKSKNDSNYTKSTSLQQNLIYIVQGDIINYFEAGKLRELAKKSNKDQDYSQALYEFGAYKSHIESIKSDFLASYSSAFELGSTQFILHNSTIDSILSNHFILKFDSESLYRSVDISSKVTTVENLIGRLNDDLRQLVNNEILDLTSDDTSLINMTLDLINSKYQLIQFKKASNSKKIKLIRSISDIISSVNANLNLEARQKEQSTILLGTLRNNIREKFVRFRDLKLKSTSFENVVCSFRQEIPIGDNIQLVLETANGYEIKKEILDGINNSLTTLSLYRNILRLLNQNSSIKNLGGNLPDNLNKKIITQLSSMFSDLSSPKDYLKYDDGETSNEKSPGYNSEKYLEIILRNPDTKTIFIDQPEDNLGNKFIAEGLVRIIREIKFQKQLFLVTHNPSVVVYGDAESIILAKNIGNVISYEQIVLENSNSQKEICSILDGGEYIFSNRSKKYNIHRLLY